ncbi:uroporphyrinogen-III methylase [Shewanella sp. WXL01]|uniref:uroporphyrinogen-III C-methyltransferase n=1 Tax=Shewanella sp. WXL01 TaxID=2709721 RepID=UPI001438652B|nr:uroporphyrinogen-III C-methyltransferase [Shewanella sp. WXL01]NKF51173.1 uroporphyrinogen-III methylase [Shewanella sp. WXL01]
MDNNKPHSTAKDDKSEALESNAQASELEQAASQSSTKDTGPEASTTKEASQQVETFQQSEPQPSQAETVQTSESGAPAAETTNSAAKTHIGVKFSLFLLLIIAVAAGGLSAWLWMSLQQQNEASMQLQQQVSAQAAQINQGQKQLNNALNATQQQLSQLQKLQQNDSKAYGQLAELESETQALKERVAVVARRSPNHWMASEAEYLVRMAGRKLWLERDPVTAAGLLEAADERIKSMRDPALMPLRQALVKDIKATKSIKSTDVVGTVYTLDSIIAQLDQLPLNRAKDYQVNTESEISDNLADWQTNLAKTWQEITESFIIIRKRTTDLEPLLAPEQQWYLVENVRNKLLQAQLAVYNYDQVNYRQSITFASNWIKQYFDLQDSRTQDALTSLDALSTLKIETATQHKFHSTKLLQQLITYGEILPDEETEQ